MMLTPRTYQENMCCVVLRQDDVIFLSGVVVR